MLLTESIERLLLVLFRHSSRVDRRSGVTLGARSDSRLSDDDLAGVRLDSRLADPVVAGHVGATASRQFAILLSMTHAADGLMTLESGHGFTETVARLRAAVESAGLVIFEHLDHAANAKAVGTSLRPTQLLVFGHPRAGTVLMADRQTAGLDLPMRALVWEDEAGTTRLTFNDAGWIASRHDLGAASADTVSAIAEGMLALAAAALVREELPGASA